MILRVKFDGVCGDNNDLISYLGYLQKSDKKIWDAKF